MKKCTIMVIVGCLFCSESALCAGKKDVVAWALGTAHLTGGGFYYYNKNKKEKGFKETNVYKGYIEGALLGVIPIIPVIPVAMFGINRLSDWLDDYENQSLYFTPKDKATINGLLAGGLSYVTIPLAYKVLTLLKKVKY